MSKELPTKFLRRAFVKTFLRRLMALVTVAGLIYGFVAVIYATKTIFKVKKNYAVVLEKFGGQREAVADIGWHARLPYFTRIEQEVPLMNQRLFLGGQLEPMRIISKGNVALWTKGVKKGEVGGSVIIGGHKKKTEKVLLHLRRMYMPLQNYKDLQPDQKLKEKILAMKADLRTQA